MQSARVHVTPAAFRSLPKAFRLLFEKPPPSRWP